MKKRIIFLVILVITIIFTRNVIYHPDETTDPKNVCQQGVESAQFGKNSASLILRCADGSFAIRCDINRSLCEQAKTTRLNLNQLQAIRISTFGDYALLSVKSQDGEVSYLEEVKSHLPKARITLLIYTAVAWAVLIFQMASLRKNSL